MALSFEPDCRRWLPSPLPPSGRTAWWCFCRTLAKVPIQMPLQVPIWAAVTRSTSSPVTETVRDSSA
jgi:hypothetical protein